MARTALITVTPLSGPQRGVDWTRRRNPAQAVAAVWSLARKTGHSFRVLVGGVGARAFIVTSTGYFAE